LRIPPFTGGLRGHSVSPAHSAAWHVGPAFRDLASWANF
jgi:hypothetical protein